MRPFNFRLIILFVFAFVGSASIYAQEHKCGTTISAKAMEVQSRFMPGYFGCEQINRLDRTLQITVHIAEDSLGNIGYNEANLPLVIDLLNTLWAPIGISFQICEIRYMENFQFNNFLDTEHLDDMLAMYYQQHTINMYLVTSVEVAGIGEVNGFAALPGGPDIMVIDKQRATAGFMTVPHEMGHFFGLIHTFETNLGVELVNGSNCETTGDLVCDTEADASDNPAHAPLPQCHYTGGPATDANGEFYVPPTNNIMSYYACRCRFTPQQYNRMLEQYLQFRSYLW